MAKYALVIGIANYSNFTNLPKAVNDAEAIAELLEQNGNFQEVKRLPAKWNPEENRWQIAPDKKLTGKQLTQELEQFLLKQAAKQEAVIYFAGHGFEIRGMGGNKKGYLATSDCSSDGQNAILLSELNHLIAVSDLSSLVMVLDCCHAGSLLEHSIPVSSTFTAFQQRTDYYLITACRSFERAREGKEHGIFTDAFLQGLSVNNADENGQVSCERLFDFIAKELRGSGQEPIRMGFGRTIHLVSYKISKKLNNQDVSIKQDVFLKNINNQTNPISENKEISTAIFKYPLDNDINYQLLRELLAAGKWEEANLETKNIILKLSGRQEKGKLEAEDCRQLPYKNLYQINQLWLEYSKGRFGFSVQLRIWRSLSQNKGADYETFKRFSDRVGWFFQGNWRSLDNLTFSLDANYGHLPYCRE